MASLSQTNKVLTLILISVAVNLSSQTDSTRFGVGVNFTSLFSGTPELQLDFFPTRKFGLSVHSAYANKTVRGGFHPIGDGAEILSRHGFFVKVGPKFRLTTKHYKSNQFYVQALYVFSYYDENGTMMADNDPPPVVALQGFVNGLAAVAGLELRFFKGLFFRTGLQYGIYSPRIHLGYDGHTNQPGLGSGGLFLNEQIIIGLAYKWR